MVSETKDYFERLMSDPQFVAEEALDYCAGEMANCLKRMAELEAENRALREFVALDDRSQAFYPERWQDDWPHDLWTVINQMEELRQRLATEHGLPLPEVER